MKFEPQRLSLPTAYKIDGGTLRCSFETPWCKDRSAWAGGLDEHHEWPKSMGGPPEDGDIQHMLNLCPTHHRRQHALIRAMIESGKTEIHTVRRFSPKEKAAAAYAVHNWVKAGMPKIGGWPCNAAKLR